MSNYYDDKVACPDCGHSPISCLDSGHKYTYYCEECKLEVTEYEGLTKLENSSTEAPQPSIERKEK